MKSTIESSDGLKRTIKITVEQDKVKDAFEKQFQKIQSEVTLKGFRKGKAPIDQIRSLYKGKVAQDVVEQLVNLNYVNAIQELDIQPISYPKIDLDQIDEDKGFTFTAEVEVKPEVELKKYTELEFDKDKIQIDEDRVQGVLEQIRESKADKVAVFEERPVQKGDFTDINFEGFIGNEPLPNGTANNFMLEIGSNSFIPGFEDGVEGMKIDEEKTINLTFPENYHAAEVAGKEVSFKVKLNKILKKSLPELNDEFVKGLGEEKVQSLDDLKNQIKDDMVKSEENRVKQKLQEEVLKKLVEANPVEAPESLVADQKTNLQNNTTQTLKQQGMNDEQVQDYLKKWDEEFNKNARDIIKSSLIVDAIAAKESLQPTDKDLDLRIEELAQGSGMDIERVKEFYQTPERKDSLRYRALENKVIDFVISKGKVNEVEPKKEEA